MPLIGLAFLQSLSTAAELLAGPSFVALHASRGGSTRCPDVELCWWDCMRACSCCVAVSATICYTVEARMAVVELLGTLHNCLRYRLADASNSKQRPPCEFMEHGYRFIWCTSTGFCLLVLKSHDLSNKCISLLVHPTNSMMSSQRNRVCYG